MAYTFKHGDRPLENFTIQRAIGRGGFGEVQLSLLLEHILAPEQYESNVAVKPNSGERVEFAVKMPGKDDDGKALYLAIDAKCPKESYEKLQHAYDAADHDQDRIPEPVERYACARRTGRAAQCVFGETLVVREVAPPKRCTQRQREGRCGNEW